MRQTTILKKEQINKKWFHIDAKGKILGKLAVRVAEILNGQKKVTFTPNVDNGDYVVVTNSDLINLSSNKLDKKKYYNHSGYPGGLRTRTARTMKANYSTEMISRAVKGMLPKNKIGRKQLRALYVYKDINHKHEAQQLESITF